MSGLKFSVDGKIVISLPQKPDPQIRKVSGTNFKIMMTNILRELKHKIDHFNS